MIHLGKEAPRNSGQVIDSLFQVSGRYGRKSPEFGEQVATVMQRAMAPQNAWRLRLDDKGDLAWESADGTLTRQPSQTFWRRVENGIFGLFPLEQHL